jgi:hypothetical protein
MYCDANLVLNILCGCGWKEKITLIHDDTRHQNTRQLFIVNFEGVKNCLFTGLWCLKFAIQWRWTFALALVMEWVCCYKWVGSWMRNVDHIARRLDGGKESWGHINRKVRVFKEGIFLNCNPKIKFCVCGFLWRQKGGLPSCSYPLLVWSRCFPLCGSLQNRKRIKQC